MFKHISVISRERILKVYLCRARIIELGLLFALMPSNNTPVYSLLGLPLLKYISHIPKAPFNTEKCKRERGRELFFFLFFFTPTARADTQ